MSQPAIFTRPEFQEVAARFRAHNADPAAGIGHPPSEMLERAYERLTEAASHHRRLVLLGWSPLDLAEDLDWARADEAAFGRHIAQVRDLLAPLNPALVLLDIDVETATERAVRQRGTHWFRNQEPRVVLGWDDRRPLLIAAAQRSAHRCRDALGAASWQPTVTVNTAAIDAAGVVQRVTEALGLPTASHRT